MTKPAVAAPITFGGRTVHWTVSQDDRRRTHPDQVLCVHPEDTCHLTPMPAGPVPVGTIREIHGHSDADAADAAHQQTLDMLLQPGLFRWTGLPRPIRYRYVLPPGQYLDHWSLGAPDPAGPDRAWGQAAADDGYDGVILREGATGTDFKAVHFLRGRVALPAEDVQ